MTAHFPHVDSKQVGYDPKTVDPVVALAREQFANPGSHVLDASTLRTSQFALIKGGYVVEAVDAALDRLDDVFAEQEANRLLAHKGHDGARQQLAEQRVTLLGRISRGNRRSFKRQQWWLKGYSVRQVDKLLRTIGATLDGDASLAVATIRNFTFAPKWGGYNEAQVDAYLDRAVQYLQISKHLG